MRQEVFKLADLFENYITQGVPLNAIKDLVESRDVFEGLEETYYEIVDDLNITEKEKRVLNSIVRESRVGSLIVMDPKSKEEVVVVEIPKELRQTDKSSKIIASSLLELFHKIQDRKIEILFTE